MKRNHFSKSCSNVEGVRILIPVSRKPCSLSLRHSRDTGIKILTPSVRSSNIVIRLNPCSILPIDHSVP
ncbi:MAG: hypothetical protein MJZ30_11510 [Paludibacteraceae bacterium]|nr:hypothetical protein [Paludibacteraceae bacterium]